MEYRTTDVFSYRCPFQHFPLSAGHYRAHFSGRGFWEVGARRLLCHTTLVVTATHIAHTCPFATAGTTLFCRRERLRNWKPTRDKQNEDVTGLPTWVQEPNRHCVLWPWLEGTLVPGGTGWLLGHWASSQSCGREDTYTHSCSD